MSGERLFASRLSRRGAEFAKLLERYRALTEAERARMRELSHSLTMADISMFARDPRLSEKLADFHDAQIDKLDLSAQRFAWMMLLTVGLAIVAVGILG